MSKPTLARILAAPDPDARADRVWIKGGCCVCVACVAGISWMYHWLRPRPTPTELRMYAVLAFLVRRDLN